MLRTIEERDIRFVRLWFTDVLGYLKSVAIAPAELEGAFAEGIGFDGSAIEGFARVYESDMLARPDPTTFTVLPWRVRAARASRGCSATSCCPTGRRPSSDPRHVLKRALGQGRRPGLQLLHPPGDRVLPAARQAAVRTARRSPSTTVATSTTRPRRCGQDFRRTAIQMLEAMGISVEFSHHEGGPGQQEIDLRYADALSTADNLMTFRTVIKEVALEQGLYATFMPKPFATYPWLRHAHPPVAVRGRPQRLLRAGLGVPAVEGGPGVHRRPASARGGDHRRHQPVGQLLQAPLRRGGGARRTSAGGTTTARPWSGCRCTSHRRVRAPAIEVRDPGLCGQPVPGVRAAAGRGHEGDRGRLRAPSAAPRTTCGTLTESERRALGIRPARRRTCRGDRRDGAQRARRRDAGGAASSTSSCATSARSGRSTAPRSRPFELQRYLSAL